MLNFSLPVSQDLQTVFRQAIDGIICSALFIANGNTESSIIRPDNTEDGSWLAFDLESLRLAGVGGQ